VSTQTPESMHHRFEKYVEKFTYHWNCPDLLRKELKRATSTWTAKCLWTVDAGNIYESELRYLYLQKR